jgi:hypothetical protein
MFYAILSILILGEFLTLAPGSFCRIIRNATRTRRCAGAAPPASSSSSHGIDLINLDFGRKISDKFLLCNFGQMFLRSSRQMSSYLGPMFRCFRYFRRKKLAKKLAFLTRNKAELCKISIITLVFEKNANFFGENWGKSQTFWAT